jgi:hypothetical protein
LGRVNQDIVSSFFAWPGLRARVVGTGRAASTSAIASRRGALGQLGLVICLFALAMGCGSKGPPASNLALPMYTPEDSALFNDLFRPELFGFPGVLAPEADQLLDERVAHASSVVPAKVVTVTLEGDGERKSYSVVVQPAEAALAGRPITDSVTLTVAANSPIFGWVEGAAQGFVGTRLLLFLRLYEDGPHFHGSVDTLAVRAAVARARIPGRRRP